MEFRPAQGDKSPYVCAECGEPVIDVDGKIYRPCGHETAEVIVDVTYFKAAS